MSQLVYLLIIFIMSFLMSSLYLWSININKGFKIVFSLASIIIFTIVCFLYNCFIFNEYVVLTILYSVYFSNVVKMCVKRKLKHS